MVILIISYIGWGVSGFITALPLLAFPSCDRILLPWDVEDRCGHMTCLGVWNVNEPDIHHFQPEALRAVK